MCSTVSRIRGARTVEHMDPNKAPRNVNKAAPNDRQIRPAIRIDSFASIALLLLLVHEGAGPSRTFMSIVPGPDHPARARVSINVVRLAPNVRQTAALVAPLLSAAMIASSFSASISGGRPPRRPRRLAAASPAGSVANFGVFRWDWFRARE